MAEDQKVPAADAPGVSPATSADAGAESSEAGAETPDSQFDMEAFRRDLAGATQEAVSRTEFESVKRQVGQTKAMQREIADLKRQLEARPSDGVSREEYDLLLETLQDSVPAERLASLNRNRAERGATAAVKTELSALEERLLARIGANEPEADPDALAPETVAAATNAQWQMASQQVMAYAKRLNVEVTQEDFLRAQATAGNPVAAVELLTNTLSERAGAGGGTRETRVEERKAAAAGGAAASGPKDGSQGNFDLSTLSGLAKARRAGAITGETFIKTYRQLNRDAGR